MTAPLESSIVRFRKSNGAVVGAGFLVSKKHVLTCAHVVADALGIARDTQDIPTEDVYLDFPLVGSETQLTARVVFWSPVPPKGSTSVKDKEDIAGLELNNSLPETELDGVVGMAVAADQKRPEAKVAFMIPTKVLATTWSDLDKLIIRSKPFPLDHKTFWGWTSLALIPALGITIFSIPQVQK
jgi:hypothetical protein